MARKTPRPAPSPDASLKTFSAVLDKALDVAVKNPDALPGMNTRPGNPVTLAPSVPEAETMVDDLIANAQNNADKWLRNVLRPRRSPVAAMKAAGGKYKNKMEEALREGRWDKGVEQIDEDAMYDTIKALGTGVFSTGVGARRAKMITKFGKLRPLFVALKDTIEKMPQDTDTQREARLVAARRGMIAIGKTMKGL